MTGDETLALADRLFRAIERGDLAVVDECYADDIVVWGNFDDRERDKVGARRVLEWMCGQMTDRRYEVRRRDLIPGGFLQEHVLHGTAPDATAVAMPACIIAATADGQITRIHEYLDPVGVAALSR